MTQAYGKLRDLLKELFQFDREDLDFGIYRIMNHKRDEILKFLDHDLLPQVKEAFGEYVKGDESQKRERMAEIEEAAARFNADPENDEEYQQLKAELGEARSVSVLENEVYSDLYTFFRRYYKNGDFLSLRRYKPGVYAVPYEGEEVKLHWANADQYYVKTAENFRNYRFELEGVGHVNFDLISAATERDNNKAANGKERRFVLREEDPVGETDGELHIYFEYRPHPDKQDALRDQARDAIFENVSGEWKTGFAEPRSTPGNKKRTLLEKHLAEYTARNTFDYFIHKDLGGFLRRELDFFLKSEVLHIDDLDTENEQRVEQYLSKLKVIKRIGYKLVVFLAQIEDFQKKLFLKKKFVVSSGYCLTLDNAPEDLYAQIVECDAQYEEWEKLFSISGIPTNLENGNGDQRSVEWLKANPYLVLDTKFFDVDFKDRLLASIENLDEKTDGLLINSENFQALNLLQDRYREQVKCIYIDPPYNTGGDDFIYKDQYQHSSWMSMMKDRLSLSLELIREDGLFFLSVDDIEVVNARGVSDSVFNSENHVGQIVWKSRKSEDARAKTGLSVDHEYVLSYRSSNDAVFRGVEKDMDKFSNPDNDPRGPWRSADLTGLATQDRRPNLHYDLIDPETGVNYGRPPKGWRYDSASMARRIKEHRIIFPPKPTGRPRHKLFLDEMDSTFKTLSSVVTNTHTGAGTREINELFGSEVASFPKPTALVRLLVEQSSGQAGLVIDYFAGSGTTGHAVINLNREDGGSRKYVLVEMGEYFDSVLKPRILKVIYSKYWRDGKPVSREGTSHIFKYMTLESYEDTLNNLSLKRTSIQDDLIESDPALREEYMLSYMLDFETKGSPSLLNLDAFEVPFSYKLNITRDDETRPANVDLVETFNYLLGLTVSRTYSTGGYRVVEGTNPAGERALVIWRNTREKSNDDLDAFFEERGYAEARFDRIYANGDNTLALNTGDAKVHLIEEEFRRLMFDTEGI